MLSPMEFAVVGVLASVTPPLIAALRSTGENPFWLLPVAALLLPAPAASAVGVTVTNLVTVDDAPVVAAAGAAVTVVVTVVTMTPTSN